MRSVVVISFALICALNSLSQEVAIPNDSVVQVVQEDNPSTESSPNEMLVEKALQDLQTSIDDLAQQRYACLIDRKTHHHRPGGIVHPRVYWIIGNEGPDKRFNARSTREPGVSFEEAWYEQVLIGTTTNYRMFWATGEKPDRYRKEDLAAKILAFDPIRQAVQSAAAIEDDLKRADGRKRAIHCLLSNNFKEMQLEANYDNIGNLIARWKIDRKTKQIKDESLTLVCKAVFDPEIEFRPVEVEFSVERKGFERALSRTLTKWQKIDGKWLPTKTTIYEPMASKEHRIGFDWRFADQLPAEPLVDRTYTDWREPFHKLYDGVWDRRNR